VIPYKYENTNTATAKPGLTQVNIEATEHSGKYVERDMEAPQRLAKSEANLRFGQLVNQGSRR